MAELERAGRGPDETHPTEGPPQPERRSILVVDDDPLSRTLIVRKLAQRGYEVTEAGDGREALDRLGDDGFHLVLLDLRMPKLDGVETLVGIRESRSPTQLPVIMLSAEEGSTRVVEALRAGANDYVVKSSDFQVLEARIETQLRLRSLTEQIEHLAVRDTLTGLLNRRGFYQEAKKEVARARRYGGELHVLLADLDRFKHINDRYGHRTGDRVLVQTARCCLSRLRTSDLIGRWGGEEFAVLLPETGAGGSRRTANRLRKAVAGLRVEGPAGDVVPVTLSAGVARMSPDCSELAKLLHRADQALYEAKRMGRNRVETWRRELAERPG